MHLAQPASLIVYYNKIFPNDTKHFAAENINKANIRQLHLPFLLTLSTGIQHSWTSSCCSCCSLCLSAVCGGLMGQAQHTLISTTYIAAALPAWDPEPMGGKRAKGHLQWKNKSCKRFGGFHCAGERVQMPRVLATDAFSPLLTWLTCMFLCVPRGP